MIARFFIFIFLLTVTGSPLSGALPKMSTSDWPVFEFAYGLQKDGQLSKFDFYFERYKDTIQRFENESIDVTFLSMYDYINISRKKPNKFVAIAVIDYSNGGDAMVVKPYITSVPQLKDKAIGIQVDSLSLWLLYLILKQGGLKLSEVQLKDVSAELIDKAFANKMVDAVVGWQPNVTRTMEKTPGEILKSSADFPGEIYDLIVVNRGSLPIHRNEYVKLLKIWFKATKNDRVISKMAEKHSASLEEYKSWLNDAHIFYTLEDSIAQLPKIKANANEILKFYDESQDVVPKIVKQFFGPIELDKETLFDFSLMQEALNQERVSNADNGS